MILLPCIICDAELEPVLPEATKPRNQPYGGVVFQSHGQYGSTVFDEMDASYLEVTICDDCLTSLKSRVLHYTVVRYVEPLHEAAPWAGPDVVN